MTDQSPIAREHGRKAYVNGYDHYECPHEYRKNGLATPWLEGWIKARRGDQSLPVADIGYCLCGTVWNIEALADLNYPCGCCPDCGEEAAAIERAKGGVDDTA